MAVANRSSIVKYGPQNGSAWVGGYQFKVLHTAGEYIVYTVPRVTTNSPGGAIVEGLPGSSNVIQNLCGITVTPNIDHTAAIATWAMNFNLYRDGALIGGSGFAGWAAGASPLLDQWVPLWVPFTVANTALMPGDGSNMAVSTTRALLPLQTNDVITVLVDPGAITDDVSVTLDII